MNSDKYPLLAEAVRIIGKGKESTLIETTPAYYLAFLAMGIPLYPLTKESPKADRVLRMHDELVGMGAAIQLEDCLKPTPQAMELALELLPVPFLLKVEFYMNTTHN